MPEHRQAREVLDRLRIRLSAEEGGVPLALLGLLSGLVAGAVIVAFRLGIETAQSSFLPGGGTETYEALDGPTRLGLCLAGGLLVGLLLQAVPARGRAVGIVHVLERLARHQGHLPLRNAVTQFMGASLSIVAGHSVGREGPAVHLGAASGSLLGVRLGVPNSVVRTLVACGVAASIGASFNTPLAGVIFAMEVVMMEYTISGFTPVILAAASATALSRMVYGAAPAFSVPPLGLVSLGELPLVLLTGLVVGILAAAFTRALLFFSGALPRLPVWARCTVGGLAAGAIGVAVPAVMGIGYDTVDRALLGEGGPGALAVIALAKIAATAVALGLGLPGG
jgi:H+/Cl- antiporter ClcA